MRRRRMSWEGPGISFQTYFSPGSVGVADAGVSASGTEAVGDGVSPPLAECFRGHLRARRHLAALVFVAIEAPRDVPREPRRHMRAPRRGLRRQRKIDERLDER